MVNVPMVAGCHSLIAVAEHRESMKKQLPALAQAFFVAWELEARRRMSQAPPPPTQAAKSKNCSVSAEIACVCLASVCTLGSAAGALAMLGSSTQLHPSSTPPPRSKTQEKPKNSHLVLSVVRTQSCDTLTLTSSIGCAEGFIFLFYMYSFQAINVRFSRFRQSLDYLRCSAELPGH